MFPKNLIYVPYAFIFYPSFYPPKLENTNLTNQFLPRVMIAGTPRPPDSPGVALGGFGILAQSQLEANLSINSDFARSLLFSYPYTRLLTSANMSQVARKTFMKNWFAVEVGRNFLLVQVSVRFGTGLKSLGFVSFHCRLFRCEFLSSFCRRLPSPSRGGREMHCAQSFGGLVEWTRGD